MIASSLLALTGAAFFGLSFLLMRRAQLAGVPSGIDLLAVALVNLAMSAALLGFQAGTGAWGGVPDLALPGIGWFALAGLLSNFGGRYFTVVAMRYIGPSRAVAFKSLAPIVAALTAWLLLAEPLGLRLGAATLLAGTGLWMLTQEIGGRTQVATSPARLLIGTLLGGGSALAWGTGFVARRFALAIVPSVTLGVLIGSIITVGVLLAITVPKHGAPWGRSFFGARRGGPMLLLAGITSTFGQLCAFGALQYAESTAVAVTLISLDPLFMLILSRAVIGRSEVITSRTFASMALTLAGCALALAA